ncbi:unnamed protein product [Mytilus edulis]|uniref:Uncharacterized protein n=1 Tax=Mytilus edulis TaxID=6550 RepID=A0A8S3VHZ5_MYTED|nr:unnamed protein product [Mytilus edulis]
MTNMIKQVDASYHCGIVLIFCVFIAQSTSKTLKQNTTIDLYDDYSFTGLPGSCLLTPVDQNIAYKVDKMAEDGAKVIYIYFKFQNFTGTLHEEKQSSVYRPLSWVWTVGRHGRSLLLLRPQYEVFSLTSLSLGTERIEVSVKQIPLNCLTQYNATVVSDALGEFLLHKFKTPSSNTSATMETLKETEHVCNLNIAPRNGKAIFYYVCCHKTLSGQTECQELKSDRYLTILFICIFLMNFFAVMFSPLVIPSKFYKKKFETTSYEHELNEPVTLTVRKSSTKSEEQHNFPISYFDKMTEFKKTIESLCTDVTYTVSVRKIDIVTEMARLLPSNRVPVGLFESLHSALVNCEIRKKPSMKDCCESNVLDLVNLAIVFFLGIKC